MKSSFAYSSNQMPYHLVTTDSYPNNYPIPLCECLYRRHGLFKLPSTQTFCAINCCWSLVVSQAILYSISSSQMRIFGRWFLIYHPITPPSGYSFYRLNVKDSSPSTMSDSWVCDKHLLIFVNIWLKLNSVCQICTLNLINFLYVRWSLYRIFEIPSVDLFNASFKVTHFSLSVSIAVSSSHLAIIMKYCKLY